MGMNAFRGGPSDLKTSASSTPMSKANRKALDRKQAISSSPKATRGYLPLQIQTSKRALPVSASRTSPSTVPSPRKTSRRPSLSDGPSASDSKRADMAWTNSSAAAWVSMKPCVVSGSCRDESDAARQKTAFRKPAENGATTLPLARDNPQKVIQGSSSPETTGSAGTSSSSLIAEHQDAAVEVIKMGQMRMLRDESKNQKETATVRFSEPMSLCNSDDSEGNYTTSCKSMEDAFNGSADTSASKTRELSEHNMLLLPKKGMDLQPKVANKEAMCAKMGSTQPGARERLETCLAPDLQQSTNKSLHQLPQRFEDTSSNSTTQNKQITETRAENRLANTALEPVPHPRLVHQKLETKPTSIEHLAAEHGMFRQRETSSLVDILRSTSQKFKHCKVVQTSKQTESEETVDAAVSRGQCGETTAKLGTIKLQNAQSTDKMHISKVVNQLSSAKQTTGKRLGDFESKQGNKMPTAPPCPDSENTTGGQEVMLDLASMKRLSRASKSCHAKGESNTSYQPAATWRGMSSEDSKVSKVTVIDSLSLTKSKASTASSEKTHSPEANPFASVRAKHEKAKRPQTEELQSEVPEVDPLYSDASQEWKDAAKARKASGSSGVTARQKKLKSVPEGSVNNFFDMQVCLGDRSEQDDESPFVTRRKAKGKRIEDKKQLDVKGLNKRELIENVHGGKQNRVREVCDREGLARTAGKDIGNKMGGLVKNVADENELCKKNPGEVERDVKEVDETKRAKRQVTEESEQISDNETRIVRKTGEDELKKAESVRSTSVVKNAFRRNTQQNESSPDEEGPYDELERVRRAMSRAELYQIRCCQEKDDKKELGRVMPEESKALKKKWRDDGESEKEKRGGEVPLEKGFDETDIRREKGNQKRVIEDIFAKREQATNWADEERHNERAYEKIEPITERASRNEEEQRTVYLDLTKLSDENQTLEELSNEMGRDDLSNEDSFESVLSEDESVTKVDAQYVPFSLESDDDTDKSSYFFSSSWQKKEIQLNFTQKSPDSEELFPWLGENQPKPKRSVQFAEPLFRMASPANDETEGLYGHKSGSSATSPSDGPWKNAVDRCTTSTDGGSSVTCSDNVVQELRSDIEKHRAILTANCLPEFDEPSLDWSELDDNQPEPLGSSTEQSTEPSPNFRAMNMLR